MTKLVELNVPITQRDSELKWNGWGYNDSSFQLNKQNNALMTGNRYEISNKVIPNLRPWFETNMGIDIQQKTPSIRFEDLKIPESIFNDQFIEFLQNAGISFSNGQKYRVNRSHGHTVHDMLALRCNHLERIPDIVVWPKSEQEVEKIVEAANQFNTVLIPLGGGTSVTNAVNCPTEERRCICSVDMCLMDKIIWIDEDNLLARVQAGAIGIKLERELNAKGYTCGHEPDSFEFSSVGGWVSTRASGMKKNKYGNIEDLLVHVNMVTSKGTIKKQCQVPRISSGPDIHNIILGSEGSYGIITEVTIKIFPVPEKRMFGSIVFPNFAQGVNFFREVARQRCQPASLRLVDNEQFIMGQSMKTESTGFFHNLSSALSKAYITKWKGFKIDEMVAATCVFEGSEEEVNQSAKHLYNVAAQFGGVVGGEENGKYGYRLTFAIAYLRDLGMEYGVLGESFETSVPWDKVNNLCKNVKELLKRETANLGVKYPVLASCRVTQVYDAGACIYFYFGFNGRGLKNALEVYDKIEIAARNEIISCGGSISHHHGVGKLRKRWLQDTISPVGVNILQSVKRELDPNNVFASNNLLDSERSKL
ncbi:Alkylglycerone-phosphate synthase [Aphelenchoides bicaudatus]|nr:Alkylglycerone-phosphate synthase [Aphelenchoides bicaudatus]